MVHYQGRNFDREMQVVAGSRVVVGRLAVRAAGLVDAIAWPVQSRAERSVLFVGPQRAMAGLAELVEPEIGCRYFDAVSVAECDRCYQAATLRFGQVQK